MAERNEGERKENTGERGKRGKNGALKSGAQNEEETGKRGDFYLTGLAGHLSYARRGVNEGRERRKRREKEI